MIGFGCMDNFVMIQAGDLIDNTIGVKFGLATLTAAAFGQICSDVSGVAFGGVIEAAAVRLGLPIADLTPAQRRLPNVKLVGTLGMMCGVVLGCLIGMASLLFLDLESAERAKHQAELNTIFETVLHHGHKVINAERASLFILDEEKGVLWSKVATGTGHAIISLPKDKGLVGLCYRTGEPVIVDNAYKHKDFNQEVDAMLEYKTRSVLCWPIFADAQVSDGNNCECKFTSSSLSGEVGKHGRQSGRIIGVIEMINKIEDEEGEKSFTSNDLKLCEMLATMSQFFSGNKANRILLKFDLDTVDYRIYAMLVKEIALFPFNPLFLQLSENIIRPPAAIKTRKGEAIILDGDSRRASLENMPAEGAAVIESKSI
eukprot:CAMPEP_0114508064 /NCGR_PEP_ID=MMETSP0109-20121206/12375_1 /TAXON_ID=29199 /ORGANISM="Chlorarachnion reptans, Strain CCCM449" /LENGTH=371 /DNA_ID=CAMNT_0001686921 /DNA_START=421 /DNA_END=1537 /DNA_ORIENTATION=+